MDKRSALCLKSCLLAAVMITVFRPTFQQPFHALDDMVNVVENPLLEKPLKDSFKAVWRRPYAGLYIPVTYSVWRVLAIWSIPDALTGKELPDPRVYHAVNVGVHILSVIGVFLILVRLFRRDLPAFWGALVFGLHPLQVEPVAWITGLKDVLSGCLVLWALYGVVYGTGAGVPDSPSSGGVRDGSGHRSGAMAWPLAAVTFAYLAAVLSKPSAVVFPLMAAALLPMMPASRRGRLTKWLVIWALVAAGVVLMTRTVQPDRGFASMVSVYKRLLIAPGVYGFYIVKAVVPLRLAVTYGMDVVTLGSRMPVPFLLGGLLVPAAAALLWRLRRNPGYLVAGFLFCVGLLPVSGILPFGYQNYSVVADRYAYTALLGIGVAVAQYLRTHRTPHVYSAAAGIVILLGTLTTHQLSFWNDDVHLMKHALEVKPDNFFAYLVLSNMYRIQGQSGKADAMYRKALETRFSDPEVVRDLEKLLKNVRSGGQEAGKLEEIKSVMDGSWQMLNDIGVRLMEARCPEEAKRVFRKAMALNPSSPEVYLNDGILAMRMGRFEDALRRFEKAARLAPQDWRIPNNLGNAYYRMNRMEEAERAYRRALELAPQQVVPRVNLANVFMSKQAYDQAEPLLEAALHSTPDLLTAAVNLGFCRQKQGDFAGAETAYRKALVMDADNLQARFNLAVILEKTGRAEEALQMYEYILSVNPKAEPVRKAVSRLQARLESR